MSNTAQTERDAAVSELARAAESFSQALGPDYHRLQEEAKSVQAMDREGVERLLDRVADRIADRVVEKLLAKGVRVG